MRQALKLGWDVHIVEGQGNYLLRLAGGWEAFAMGPQRLYDWKV